MDSEFFDEPLEKIFLNLYSRDNQNVRFKAKVLLCKNLKAPHLEGKNFFEIYFIRNFFLN